MSGPGENQKVVGNVVAQEEFEMIVLRNRAQPHHITDATVMPRGNKYAFAYLENHAFAVFSQQTGRVYVLELMDLIHLAQDAGLDKDAPLIVLPGSEVHRG
jgi:hypothetical protein